MEASTSGCLERAARQGASALHAAPLLGPRSRPAPARASTSSSASSRGLARGAPAGLRPAAALRQGSSGSGVFGSSSSRGFVLSNARRRSRPGDGVGGRGSHLVVRADVDFYSVLGVPKTADKKDIKSAYRSKARQFHPDVNKDAGAEERFKQISNAYEVLSDDQKRSIYDKYGEAGLKGGMGGMGGGDPFGNPFDLFEQFFGGRGGGGGFGGFGGMGGQRTPIYPGEDLKYEATLDFTEAVFGNPQKDITVTRLDTCGTCSGDGNKPGTTPTTCTTCKGAGQLVQSVRTPLGTFQQVSTCSDCGGAGQRATPCGTCKGDGRVRKSKTISLRVPAGVDTNTRLRVSGEGNAGRKGGEPGDLFVFITVRSHPEMRREGATILSDVEIKYTEAILGTTAKVTTVDGPVDLKIPPGTQPNTTLLMSKRGAPVIGRNTRGDHEVRVKVTIPTRLSKDEQKLVEQLRDLQAKQKAGFWGI